MTRFDENGKNPKNQQKSSAPNSRDARLAAALRENLRRRKAQERGRGASAEDGSLPPPGTPASGDENP
jgi:hypothetical protein